jgi:ferredoxin-NADP reductase
VTPKWRIAEIVEVYEETPTAKTLTLRIPDWPGQLAGQHLDIRLTAADGYTATRSYSIASRPGLGLVDVSVELMKDGEVSPYLVLNVSPGDQLEVLGPIGGWFVWNPRQLEPVQLIAGGSGVAPLRAMLSERMAEAADGVASAAAAGEMRLLYSARSGRSVYYREELDRLAEVSPETVTIQYTRRAPADWAGTIGRVDKAMLDAVTIPADRQPTVYVCGPTAFVESVATSLLELGHDQARVRTERFG